jgi:serine protease Do
MPARIIKSDGRRDVAVLQVEASGLQAATMGDANALRVGELVVAVGNPLGFTGAASTGVVHRLSDSWVVSQLRLAPGNSGGPLANASGEVVGINTMIAGGLAFAIPSQSVAQLLSTARRLKRDLGVVVRTIRAEFIVLEVDPGSPADRASLLPGDILVGARSLEGILEIQFRRGTSQNLRTVAIRIAASVRAA